MVEANTQVNIHIDDGDRKRYGGLRIPTLYWSGIKLLAEHQDTAISKIVTDLIDAGLRAEGLYPIRLHGSVEDCHEVRAYLATRGEVISIQRGELYEDVLLRLEKA